MKLRLKDFTLTHYIKHVRRQSKHVQHVHAFVFAGAITSLIAAFVLYTNYGFWHETYHAEDDLIATGEYEEIPSPSESLGSFWSEIKSRIGSIEVSPKQILEGKETYTKEE